MATDPIPLSEEALTAVEHAVHELPDACERLRYVKEMTEKAANKVFALVEAIQAHAEQMDLQSQALADAGLSAEAVSLLRQQAEQQRAWATELLMSQDFQDLSGQVINKVLTLLTSVEKPLEHVLQHAGTQAQDHTQVGELAGVQTPDKALKQDDVDDLLASLGF
ncbi:MAG: protein phosphatase CheZ [Burkholderiales bacterium]|uniref:protein phosphatase CheZ n=1 Tax=Inhella sp. TaxID=1921806 RepID=UPI001AC1BD01|nr:protein phosphatase CheZ [Burkholderiales bacterium]